MRRGTIVGRVAVSVAKAGCIGTMGIILACLTYTTPQPPLSFWFAVGILGYGFLNLFTGALHSYRMAREPGATAEQSHPEATSEAARSAASEASDA